MKKFLLTNRLKYLLVLLLAAMTATKAVAQESYAVFTPSNTTLTFYCDKNKTSRTGTVYSLPDDGNSPGWLTDSICRQVTNVAFHSSFAFARPKSTALWFSHMNKLTNITGMENYLNTSEATTMRGMFYECSKLSSIDVSKFDTHEVLCMKSMFYGCEKLSKLDLSSFDTENVWDMSYMFANCYTLQSLDISSLRTSSVTNMYAMFSSCRKLKSLDLSSFRTEQVMDMAWMFYECETLTTLDLSSFNTQHVLHIDGMFNYCTSLTTVYVSQAWDTETTLATAYVFYDCIKLVGGKGTTYSEMNNSYINARIDEGTAKPGMFTEKYTAYAVVNANALTFYYDGKRSSRAGTVYSLNNASQDPGWYTDGLAQNITSFNFDPSFEFARPVSTRRWFANMTGLTSRNVGTFYYCNTDKVEDMSCMFAGCSALTKLDLKHFETGNVTTMEGMFRDCTALQTLDVRFFNTSKVTDMSLMFYNCNSLTDIDLTGFRTHEVTNMRYMFYKCYALTTLDLSSFETESVTNMQAMFCVCSKLKTIYVGNSWKMRSDVRAVDMFAFCSNLIGGMGTAWNSANTNGGYAHVDEGTGNPGYFTATKAYAVLTGNTLTFYYDDNKPQRTGTVYSLSGIGGNWLPLWTGNASSVKKVVFDASFSGFQPKSMYAWFYGMSDLTQIDGLNHLDTYWVADMRSLFKGCSSIKTIDLNHFNTNNLRYADLMFNYCKNLETIYVGTSWYLTKLKSSSAMFENCDNLVGMKGTAYSDYYYFTDASYAHVDGGAANPGYLSVFKYPLWIGGVQVDEFNRMDVLDDGCVYFDPSTKTLTLTKANVRGATYSTSDNGYGAGIYSEIDGLIIESVGNNHVYSGTADFDGIKLNKQTTFTGSGKLYAEGNNGVKLTRSVPSVIVDDNIFFVAKGGEYGIVGSYHLVIKERIYISTLIVRDNAVVMAIGTTKSLADLENLDLQDLRAVISPAGAAWNTDKHAVCNAYGDYIKNEYVTIGKGSSIPGDVNQDGAVNINDVVAIINVMAGTASWPNANVNNDPEGAVDINDVVAVINIMAGLSP